MVSCSFSDPEALVQGKVFFLPVNPGLQGYQAVFQNTKVWRGYGNTILYTVVGTAVGVAVSITASYVLSRKEFPLHKFLSGFFMFTMFFWRRNHTDVSLAEIAWTFEYYLGNRTSGSRQCMACNGGKNLSAVIDTRRTF